MTQEEILNKSFEIAQEQGAELLNLVTKIKHDYSLDINKDDLDNEFADQPVKYFYWAALTEVANDKMLRLKHALEHTYAQIEFEVRTSAKENSVKLTEAMVEGQTKSHTKYQSKLDEYLDACALVGKLKACKEAMAQRKDMLVSLGANNRLLNQSNISMNELKRRS